MTSLIFLVILIKIMYTLPNLAYPLLYNKLVLSVFIYESTKFLTRFGYLNSTNKLKGTENRRRPHNNPLPTSRINDKTPALITHNGQ